MKTSLMTAVAAIGLAVTVSAKPVTSASVPVGRPENVFDPIPEAAGGGDSARLADTTNVFTAAYAEDFTIDGDISKDVWRSAPSVGKFLPRSGTKASSDTDTDLRLLYSSTALYVGATLFQPMDKVVMRYDQDEQPIHDDDCLEAFFLVPNGKGEDMVHIAVNALGSCWDALNGREVWNAKGREVKVRRFPDRWTMEMRLPYGDMERPVPGDFVGARFNRGVGSPFTRTSAPKMAKPGNNGRHSFAKLVFAEPANGAAATEARAFRAQVEKMRTAQRLAEVWRRMASQEAAAMQFPDQTHPAYNAAVQAVHQMKDGIERFRAGALSTNDFIALDAGFRKYAGEHAYTIWIASPWDKGDPNRLPPSNCAGLPRLSFEQAGNEREQVCLEFTGLLCGPRLDLRLVPQTIDEPRKKRFVSCDAFEIYEEPFVNYEKDLITAPLVRKSGNVVTLTPGRTTRVWVVFNSRGVSPGEYSTSIVLKPAYDTAVAEKSIDVDMKVWNFALPETRDWPLQMMFFGAERFDNDEAQLLRLMHDHHVTHGWTKSQLYTTGVERDDFRVRKPGGGFYRHIAETANERFFLTAKELGMRFMFGRGFPKDQEWYQIMDRRLSGMGFERSDYVFSRALIRDEFLKKDIPTFADDRAAFSHRFGTNLWCHAVYLSTPPPAGATMDDIEEAKLPEFYKIWSIIESLVEDPKRGPDVIRRLRAKGCKVWSYTCAQYLQTLDVCGYFRLYPWKCYMRGLDGATMWCDGLRVGSDGWDSRDGYDDGILWYDPGKCAIPTKRFEAFREGLEDVAYMDLLTKAIAGAKGRGVAQNAVKEAQSLLDVRGRIINSQRQNELDAWRLAAGRAIDALVRQDKANSAKIERPKAMAPEMTLWPGANHDNTEV